MAGISGDVRERLVDEGRNGASVRGDLAGHARARREILADSVNQVLWHGRGGVRGGRLGSAAAARVGLTDATNGTALPTPEPPPARFSP